jgi:GNAT superfamily N-acetyltransferase
MKLFGLERLRQVSLEEAIKLFHRNPLASFTYFNQTYEWPDASDRSYFTLTDVQIRVHDHALADMERLSITGGTARIQHIGVANSLTRRGIGPALAKAFALEAARRYGVVRIVFAEDHSKYHERGYDGFFEKIGAIPLPVDLRVQRADRPDYEWDQAQW